MLYQAIGFDGPVQWTLVDMAAASHLRLEPLAPGWVVLHLDQASRHDAIVYLRVTSGTDPNRTAITPIRLIPRPQAPAVPAARSASVRRRGWGFLGFLSLMEDPDPRPFGHAKS